MARQENSTNPCRRTMLSRLPAAALATAALVFPSGAISASSELSALSAQFEALLPKLDTDDEDLREDTYRQLDAINVRIREIPPTSVHDLLVKARALEWDAGLEPGPEEDPDDWDWEVKCMQSFMSDLRRFGSTRNI